MGARRCATQSQTLTHSRTQLALKAAVAYWAIWLATDENTLFALPPIRRTVPITITSITASITAYSAMSCPSSLRHKSLAKSVILDSFEPCRHSQYGLGLETSL